MKRFNKFLFYSTALGVATIATITTWLVLGRLFLLIYSRGNGADISEPGAVDYGFGMAWGLISIPLVFFLFVGFMTLCLRLIKKFVERPGNTKN